MRFAHYSREIAGWALLALALYIFWSAYNLLLDHRVFDGGPVLVIGIVLFRGGVHVLKVAVAAQAARQLPETQAAPVRRTPRLSAAPVGPTPPKAVLPGPRGAAARPGERGR